MSNLARDEIWRWNPMVNNSLTKKRAQVLQLICKSIEDFGYAPTLDELAGVFKVSRSAIFERVQGLVQRGHITKDTDKARGIALTDSGRQWYAARKRNPDKPLISSELLANQLGSGVK